MSRSAEQYEARFPETGISESQKEERMDRRAFKDERLSGRRTTRNRGIVISHVPWHDEKEAGR